MTGAADPDDLVTLRQVRSEFEANTLVAVLADEGIEAFAFGSVQGSLPLSSKYTSVPVQVRRRDHQRALDVLRASEQSAGEVDWEGMELEGPTPDSPGGPPRRRRMPWPAALGFVVAVLALLMVLAAFGLEVFRMVAGGP